MATDWYMEGPWFRTATATRGVPAETAVSTKLVAKGDIEYSLESSHSSMAYVRHGNKFQERYTPTVVDSN